MHHESTRTLPTLALLFLAACSGGETDDTGEIDDTNTDSGVTDTDTNTDSGVTDTDTNTDSDSGDTDTAPPSCATGMATWTPDGGSPADWTSLLKGTTSAPAEVVLDTPGALELCGGRWHIALTADAAVQITGSDSATLTATASPPKPMLTVAPARTASISGFAIESGPGRVLVVDDGTLTASDLVISSDQTDLSGFIPVIEYRGGTPTLTLRDSSFTNVTTVLSGSQTQATLEPTIDIDGIEVDGFGQWGIFSGVGVFALRNSTFKNGGTAVQISATDGTPALVEDVSFTSVEQGLFVHSALTARRISSSHAPIAQVDSGAVAVFEDVIAEGITSLSIPAIWGTDSYDITVTNSTFTGQQFGAIAGNPDSGASPARLLLTGVTIADTHPSSTARGVRAMGGELVMNQCSLSNLKGGGVVIGGAGTSLAMTGGSITGSEADIGGGLVVAGGSGDVVITDTTFNNNAATSHGGAIHMNQGGKLSLTRPQFQQNRSQHHGGAVYLAGVSPAPTWTGLVCEGNEATGSGGCVYANGPLNLDGGRIEANSASEAGGIWFINHLGLSATAFGSGPSFGNTPNDVSGGTGVDLSGTVTATCTAAGCAQ